MAFAVLTATPTAALAGPRVQVHLTTSDLTSRVTREPDVRFRSGPTTMLPTIVVDPARRYQRFVGAGAALTDTSAWLIHDELGSDTRARVLEAMFGRSGARLSFLRVPIGASDFTAGPTPYSYDDLPAGQADSGLQRFSIEHDLAYVLPTLRAILALRPSLYTMASPWSAPGWMKTNGALGNMYDRGRLRAGQMATFADYLVRFLRAYARRGVRFHAITPQNEPGNPTQYPGMNVAESDEETFVEQYLAPALRRARQAVALFGYDWGWARNTVGYARRLEASPAAGRLTGVASHCYFGSPSVLSTLHRENPRLMQIVSECSPGITPYSTSELLISSLRNWASAVSLWNLAVDPVGGPVEQPNLGCPNCSGLVTIDEGSGAAIPTIDLYQLAQLTRFAVPGAIRIATPHFVRYSYHHPHTNIASAGIDDVALQNPDGTIVLLVYDNSSQPAGFVVSSGGESFPYLIEPGAVATFTWRPRLQARARAHP